MHCVNHSQDVLSLAAVAPIADEIVSDLAKKCIVPDVMILGCGNGTTILGIGGRMKELIPTAQCIAFDPFEAPVAFERKFPGRYAMENGLEAAIEPHRIIGTGGLGVHFPFISDPHFTEVVDDVKLVDDGDMVRVLELLGQREHIYPGFSSAAATSVALKLAAEVKNKVFVVIFYDEKKYYDLD